MPARNRGPKPPVPSCELLQQLLCSLESSLDFVLSELDIRELIPNGLEELVRVRVHGPALDILFGVLGIMLGLLLAFLLSLIVRTINVPILPEIITLRWHSWAGAMDGHCAGILLPR